MKSLFHKTSTFPAIILLAAALGGCGGGGGNTSSAPSTASNSSQDSGSTSSSGSTSTTPAQPAVPYPAFTPPLPVITSHVAKPQVIAHPIVIPVFFPGTPDQSATAGYLQSLVQSNNWGTLAQYGVTTATIGTPIVASSNPPATVTTTDIDNFVGANAAAWTPSPTGSEIYVLFYPTSTTSIANNPGVGYHTVRWLNPANFNSAVEYAVIPYKSLQADAYLIYHEIAETATDPNIQGYYWPNIDSTAWLSMYDGYMELADACTATDFFPESDLGQAEHAIFSDANVLAGQSPCSIPSSAANSLQMFGGFPVLTATQASQKSSLNPNAQNIDHVVHIAPGASVTIPVKLFSYGPLPAAINVQILQLNLASDKSNAATFTLDKSTGNNGDTINLTITAPSTALSGSTPYITFSVLTMVRDSSGNEHYGYPFPGMVVN